MTQMRYHMDNGFVMVEHTEREVLEQIRKNDSRFKGRHIYELLQMRPSLIQVGVVYEVDSNPPRVADQIDAEGVRHFHDHNGSRVDYPKGTKVP